MKFVRLTIPGEFTQLNDYIRAERGHMIMGSKIKKSETNRVMQEIMFIKSKSAMKFIKKELKKGPLAITFMWLCKNKRKDPDNISFAQKFILDGLVGGGVLPDDGWKTIGSLTHRFRVDKDDPGVIVLIGV